MYYIHLILTNRFVFKIYFFHYGFFSLISVYRKTIYFLENEGNNGYKQYLILQTYTTVYRPVQTYTNTSILYYKLKQNRNT